MLCSILKLFFFVVNVCFSNKAQAVVQGQLSVICGRKFWCGRRFKACICWPGV